jgi:hypothetical protein
MNNQPMRRAPRQTPVCIPAAAGLNLRLRKSRRDPSRSPDGAPIVNISMRIGTRKSTMALAQTQEIARRLQAAAPDIAVEIVTFETIGDTDQTSKLLMHGGKGGAFVAEIRSAILAGKLHAAMHSLRTCPAMRIRRAW